MKLYSNEALCLGGIFSVVSAPFIYAGIESVALILLFAFVVLMFGIAFNKVPFFITYMINHHPEITYYLSAIGWIPYFAIVYPVVLIAICTFFNLSDKTSEFWFNIYTWILSFGAFISLLIASIKRSRS